jgi:hypothetical protein
MARHLCLYGCGRYGDVHTLLSVLDLSGGNDGSLRLDLNSASTYR